MTTEPSLAREILAAAWGLAKILAIVAAAVFVAGLILWPLRQNTAAFISACYGLMLVAMVVFAGWQSWKWKKRDYERERERERTRQALESAQKARR